jgi:mannose-6-phosphate isomerase-like protein (cupin superfamily)
MVIVTRMLVRKLQDCKSFIAGDGSLLREILHPAKHAVEVRYSLAWAELAPKQKTKPHALTHAEIYYILSGDGLIHINDEAETVQRDDTIYIPAGAVQFIENITDGNLQFLCIVDPAWRPEIETVTNNT